MTPEVIVRIETDIPEDGGMRIRSDQQDDIIRYCIPQVAVEHDDEKRFEIGSSYCRYVQAMILSMRCTKRPAGRGRKQSISPPVRRGNSLSENLLSEASSEASSVHSMDVLPPEPSPEPKPPPPGPQRPQSMASTRQPTVNPQDSRILQNESPISASQTYSSLEPGCKIAHQIRISNSTDIAGTASSTRSSNSELLGNTDNICPTSPRTSKTNDSSEATREEGPPPTPTHSRPACKFTFLISRES